MNRGLYTAATGMTACQQWLDCAANNLANLSTTAYKRDEIDFHESMQKTLRANGGKGAVIGQIQSGPGQAETFINFEKGSSIATGNPFDLCIQTSSGMFAVQTPTGVEYTRNGNFKLNQDGRVVSSKGYAVLDDQGNDIVIQGDSPKISPNGSIAVGGKQIAKIGVFTGDFKKLGESMYSVNGKATVDASPELMSGALESSNVNPIQAMVEMVQIQRLYEMAQRSVQQHDEASAKLVQSIQGG